MGAHECADARTLVFNHMHRTLACWGPRVAARPWERASWSRGCPWAAHARALVGRLHPLQATQVKRQYVCIGRVCSTHCTPLCLLTWPTISPSLVLHPLQTVSLMTWLVLNPNLVLHLLQQISLITWLAGGS